jgi:GR25 family glycosyltransferase involved in LPS biosynthesis
MKWLRREEVRTTKWGDTPLDILIYIYLKIVKLILLYPKIMNLEIKEINTSKRKDNKPTMCLNMIVKNESKVIFNTLMNLTQKIDFDYWVISDTGSTDGTQDMIQTFFWNKGIPGEIVHHEWQDFGHNRTKALEAAYGKTDYLFIFDADDSLQGDFKLPFDKKPYADRYMLKIGQGFEYVRPLLINNRKRWMFKGVLHEYLHNLEPVNQDMTVQGNYHIDSGRTGNRSQNPTKYYDDAIILKNAYEKEMALPDKGMSGRYAFYCARSFKDAGEKYYDDAIVWYKKVMDIQNHWNQERFYSALEIGFIYKEKKQMEESVKYLLKTIEYDAERIEGVAVAIEHFYQTGQYILINALYHKFKDYKRDFMPKLGEKLFVNKFFYNDRLEFFNGIVAYYVNDKISGYNCCKQIIINQLVGLNELTITMNNLLFYREIIERDDTLKLFRAVDHLLYKNNDLVYHSNIVELWNILLKQNRLQLTVLDRKMIKKVKLALEKNATANDKIIITFTTCKRLDLFKETINSILNQWTDVDLVTDWFCVDDNSSKEDREFMTSTYQWIDYYMKTPGEKGHRASMNIIWNKLYELKPRYWIHMEDDFLFYHPMNYITQAVEALKNKEAISLGIKQIVFNKNYAETVDNYKSKGHLSTSIPNIVLHDHKPNESITHYQNTHYWSHYSFRPSLIDVETILDLGNYDSPNKFFERDYADKWNKANYKTAFFDRITHMHTGRLTSEIGNSTVKNAYQLNDENQFNGKEKEQHIKLLNLERRPDRKLQMCKQFNEVGLGNAYTIFKAIDGNELESSMELKLLFDGNDFGSRRGVIGCALSHLKMWRELLVDKENNYYVIFEDDSTFSPLFKEQFNKLTSEFQEKEVIFLGYHMFEKNRALVKDIYDNSSNADIKIESLNKSLYIGGTFSYSINKVGAKKLVDYIEKNGIKHGIDYLMKIMPGLNSCETQPHLMFSEWSEAGTPAVDTDIQNNYQALDFNNMIEDQFEFIPRLDQIGNDIYYERGLSLTDSMLKAIKDPNCQGFNTLGFFKGKIDNLTSSQYFGEKDGIYRKRGVPPPAPHLDAEVIETCSPVCSPVCNQDDARVCAGISEKEPGVEVCTRSVSLAVEKGVVGGYHLCVKLLGNWCSSEQLCKEWSNMCHSGYKWNNIEITWSDDEREIGYYVIINYPRPGDKYIAEKTLVFQMEPWINDPVKNWGVKTWGEWSTPDPAKFFKIFTHKTHLNNVQWQININPIKVIDNGKKNNKIATICSYKNFDTGHVLRNIFIRAMEDSGANIIDVWGQENFHDFKNYRGMIEDDNKFNVYANYKYCFSAENNMEHNYATEKIWEPILCESLCFYWGCPNLEEYIDEKAFVRLPIEDPVAALQIIQQAIAEDWWSQRIGVIKQMKEKILNQLGFFPLLESILV